MSGCGSCENGWVYTQSVPAGYPCSCQGQPRPERPAFRDGYSPGGGISKKARARLAGRRGGLASGVTRRQLARGRRVPHSRTRGQALALAYRQRQLRRSEVFRLYERHFPRPERPTAASAWERGRQTLYEHYVLTFRLYRAAGQHARTTNGQRGAALSSRGRPRCRRTIQRLNRKLETLGLAVVSHYRDQRDRPGHKDCLVVEVRFPDLACHPAPTGQHQPGLRPEVGAADPKTNRRDDALTASVPPASPAMPPDGGDQQRPAAPAASEDGWEAAYARFVSATRRPPAPAPRSTSEQELEQLRLRVDWLTQVRANPAPEALRPPGRG